ncbi:riboflavin synthase [Methylophaga sp.]|uniref:riboflavin synthase n=1 Tax=Methylophaga sp. TaxID=2024840 RepID=UPI0013FF7A7B|nr:riboflavin synthase [Methylophaga sp.]MTI64124.1 riboflavin synthase [Methylophaga sp.]
MFTGIIAALGKVESVQPSGGDLRLKIDADKLDLNDVKLGDSIAVNGVCLTVVDIQGAQLSFDVSRESLDRTSLGQAKPGSSVNLEKAMAVGDRLGGHIVSGHVDGLGKVAVMEASARSVKFRFEVPANLERYIAEKGSICIDGTSLTVNQVGPGWFEVNIIPHTMQETIISDYKTGTVVNLEVDLIARYLERLLLGNKQEGISRDTLQKHGFI